MSTAYATFFKNADSKFAGCRIPVDGPESNSSLKEFIQLLSTTVFNDEKIYQLVQIPKRKRVRSVADITSGVYVCTTKSLGEAVDTSVKYKALPVKTFAYDKDGSITEVPEEDEDKGGDEGQGEDTGGGDGASFKSETKGKKAPAASKKPKAILPTGNAPAGTKKISRKKKGASVKGERKYFKIPARGSKEYIELVAAAVQVQRYWRQYYAIRYLRKKVKESIKNEKQQKKDAKREKKLKEQQKRKDAARRLHGGGKDEDSSPKKGKGAGADDSPNARQGKPLTSEELRTVGGLLGTRKINRKVVPLKLEKRSGGSRSLKASESEPPTVTAPSKSPSKVFAGTKPSKKASSSSNGSSTKPTAAKKRNAVKRRGSKTIEDEPEVEEIEVAYVPNLHQHEHTACMLPSTFNVYEWVQDNPNYMPIEEERRLWAKSWPEYTPIEYTTPSILEDPPESLNSDSELKLDSFKFNAVCKVSGAQINRISHNGKYALHPSHGMPMNPLGRTNVQGRGVFGRYGPNHGAEMILSRWKRKGGSLMRDTFDEPMLEILMIQKGLGPEWHLPGGQLAPGPNGLSANAIIEKEFEKETKLRKMPKAEKTHLKEYLTSLCGVGKSIYKGIPDDPRNTDNAWAENSIMHYHDKTGQFSSLLKRDSKGGGEQVLTPPPSPGAKIGADAALSSAAGVINSGASGSAARVDGGGPAAADGSVVPAAGATGEDERREEVPSWVGITPATNLYPCIENYIMTIRQDLVAQTGGALAKRRKRVNLKKWNVARGFMMERARLNAFEKSNVGNAIFKYATSSLVYTKENRETLMKCIKPSVRIAELKEMLMTQATIQAEDKMKAKAAAAAAAAAKAGGKGKGKGAAKMPQILYSPSSEARCVTESVADYNALEAFFRAVYAANPLNFDAETLEDLDIVEARAKAAADAAVLKANRTAITAAKAAVAAAKAAQSDSEDEDKDQNHLFLPNMDPSNPHHHLHQHHHKLHGPGKMPSGLLPSTQTLGVNRGNSDLSRQSTAISARSGRSEKSNASGRSARSNASRRSARSATSNRSAKSAVFATKAAQQASKAAADAAEKAAEAKAQADAIVALDEKIPAPYIAEDALTTSLDVLDVEVPALVIRCEFSRNFPGKFPIAMDVEERLAAEERMASVFEVLKTKKAYAGTYYSFTPDTKHQTIGPVLQTNLETHGLMMNKDVCNDVSMLYPSVGTDWPSGRGIYVADNNNQFVVWVGEVDQVKIITQKKGKEAEDTYELGRAVLNEMTAILRELPPPPEPEPKGPAAGSLRARKRRSSISGSIGLDGGGGGGGGGGGATSPIARGRSNMGMGSKSKSGMEEHKREPSTVRSSAKSEVGMRGKTNAGLDGRSRTPGYARKFSSKEVSHLGDGGLGDFEGMLTSAGSRRSHQVSSRSARSSRSAMSAMSAKTTKAAKVRAPSNPLDPTNDNSGWAWDPRFGFLTVDPNGAGAAFNCSVMMMFRANRSQEQIRGYCYKAGCEINNAPNRVKEANSRSIRIEARRFYGQSDRAIIGGLFSGIRLLRKMLVIGPKGGGKGKGNPRR